MTAPRRPKRAPRRIKKPPRRPKRPPRRLQEGAQTGDPNGDLEPSAPRSPQLDARPGDLPRRRLMYLVRLKFDSSSTQGPYNVNLPTQSLSCSTAGVLFVIPLSSSCFPSAYSSSGGGGVRTRCFDFGLHIGGCSSGRLRAAKPRFVRGAMAVAGVGRGLLRGEVGGILWA